MLADDHPLRRLAEQYPACFNLVGHERQPIKIGIGDELAALDTGLTPLQFGRALATYVRHGSTHGILVVVDDNHLVLAC